MIEYEYLETFDLSDVIASRGRYAPIIEKWLLSNAKALKFSLKSIEDRRRCRAAITRYRDSHHYDWTIYNEKNSYNLYVVRA